MSLVNNVFININYDSSLSNEKEDKDSIFQALEQLAAKPTEEILGRNFWAENSSNEKRKIYAIGTSDYISSKCGHTYIAMMSSFLGKDFETSVKVNNIDFHQPAREIKNFRILIEKNSKHLNRVDGAEFFVYGFKLFDTDIGYNTYGGHAFVVIQYLDDQKKVQYRILQSYVMSYSLQDYLQSKKGNINEVEFLEFLANLEVLISATKWSLEIQNFYRKFFDVNHNYGENSAISSPIKLKVKWGISSLSAFKAYRQNFEVYKTSEKFPKIFSLSLNGGEKCLRILKFLETNQNKKSETTASCTFFNPSTEKTIKITSSRAQLLESIASIQFSKIKDLESFFKENPQLEEFDASLLESKKLSSNFPQSLKIAILKNLEIEDIDLNTLCIKCPYLQELDISFCENITELPEHLPSSLRRVRLSFTKIKDEDVERLFTQCPNLEEVDIRYCQHLTKLPDQMPFFLERLKISKTQITTCDLDHVLTQCLRIKKVFASGCDNIHAIPEHLPASLKTLALDETLPNAKISELEKKYPHIGFGN